MIAGSEASSRSVSRSRTAVGRSTIKIRNVTEGVVYHLTFDGDLGRLVGSQLKQHIESIAGIPAAKQTLSLNGHLLVNQATGASLGLRDGSVLVLETGDAPAQPSASQSTAESTATAPPPPPAAVQRAPTAATTDDELARVEAQLADIERKRAALMQHHHRVAHQPQEAQHSSNQAVPHQSEREQSVVHHYHPGYAASDAQPRASGARQPAPTARPAPYSYQQQQQQHNSRRHSLDESVEEVEVEVEEETGLRAAWLPNRSADVEEMRLQQQDYVWKMEQVRFETERMSRDREMRRQQQELEYQATLLDRERLELERRTLAERAEFEDLQSHDRVDMEIEARYQPYLLNYYGGPGASTSALIGH